MGLEGNTQEGCPRHDQRRPHIPPSRDPGALQQRDRTVSVEPMPDGALEEMLDATPDGIVMAGHDGPIRDANRAAAALFGYRLDELIGATVEQLVPGCLREQHVADLQ